MNCPSCLQPVCRCHLVADQLREMIKTVNVDKNVFEYLSKENDSLFRLCETSLLAAQTIDELTKRCEELETHQSVWGTVDCLFCASPLSECSDPHGHRELVAHQQPRGAQFRRVEELQSQLTTSQERIRELESTLPTLKDVQFVMGEREKLESALKKCQEEKASWEETAQLYCKNAVFYRDKSESLEATLAKVVEESKILEHSHYCNCGKSHCKKGEGK